MDRQPSSPFQDRYPKIPARQGFPHAIGSRSAPPITFDLGIPTSLRTEGKSSTYQASLETSSVLRDFRIPQPFARIVRLPQPKIRPRKLAGVFFLHPLPVEDFSVYQCCQHSGPRACPVRSHHKREAVMIDNTSSSAPNEPVDFDKPLSEAMAEIGMRRSPQPKIVNSTYPQTVGVNGSDYLACINDRLGGVMKGCAGLLNDISTIERFLFGKDGVVANGAPKPMAQVGLPAIEERLMLAIEQLQAASHRHRDILTKLGFTHTEPDPRPGRFPSPPPLRRD